MARNIVGAVVTGADFYGRTDELKALELEGLRQDILLLAPRRVGKTSLLNRFVTVAESRGYRAVYVSVEDAKGEMDFIKKVYGAIAAAPAAQALSRRAKKSALARFAARVEKLGPISLGDPAKENAVGEIVRELGEALDELQDHWFILIDEFPLYLTELLEESDGAARIASLLAALRSLRVRPPRDVKTIHWVYCGSIGLDALTNRLGLSYAINDFSSMRLGAFSPEVAGGLLGALGESSKLALDDAVRQRMLEKIGWLIPHHIQALFQSVRELAADRSETLSPELVDEAFERLLGKHLYFNDWSERLTRELGAPLDRQARALLKVCARDEHGPTRSTLDQTLAKLIKNPDKRDAQLRFLLDVLLNDGYLRLERDGGEERYPFRSSLLRAFWLRRFAL